MARGRLLLTVVFLSTVGAVIVYLLRDRPRYVTPPPSVEDGPPRTISDCSARGFPMRRTDYQTICVMLYFQAGCQGGDRESCVQLRSIREGLAPIVCPPPGPAPADHRAPDIGAGAAAPPSRPQSRALDLVWPGTPPAPPDGPAPDLRPADLAEPPAAGPGALPLRAQEQYLSRVLGSLSISTVEVRSC